MGKTAATAHFPDAPYVPVVSPISLPFSKLVARGRWFRYAKMGVKNENLTRETPPGGARL